ncbi:MAG: PqqD family protein [Oscillospiraceae bacterium]|nr:PqqD family protein [Oscillospiraceae bacterium]
MKATSEVVLREIAGENLLIPVGQTALKIHGMITLSESGLLLWKRLQTECTEDELVEALLTEYQVDRETAAADVKAFIRQMQEVGILEES